MLHTVISDIAVIHLCVHLEMDNPQDCSVKLEDEHLWPYLRKMVQNAGVSKDLCKNNAAPVQP